MLKEKKRKVLKQHWTGWGAPKPGGVCKNVKEERGEKEKCKLNTFLKGNLRKRKTLKCLVVVRGCPG